MTRKSGRQPRGYHLAEDDYQLMQAVNAGERITALPVQSRKYTELITGILFQFADSQMAGAAGYAKFINRGPTIVDRIHLAKIAAEKMSLARDTYLLLRELGLNLDKYFAIHCWDARIERNVALGFSRASSDKRLNALMYPIESWPDLAVFTYLMAKMACFQLEEFINSSFSPWATLALSFLPVEQCHAGFGLAQMQQLAAAEANHEALQLALDYWHNRVAASFGPADSEKNELYRQFELKGKRNEDLSSAWQAEVMEMCRSLRLCLPEMVSSDAAARN